jgi:hypothetical protein
MLQLSAIEQNTFELLKKLQKLPLLAKTRLVGGTALYYLKYNDGSIFAAMKSLTFFDDAEDDIMPDMLIKKSWKQAKKEIAFRASTI